MHCFDIPQWQCITQELEISLTSMCMAAIRYMLLPPWISITLQNSRLSFHLRFLSLPSRCNMLFLHPPSPFSICCLWSPAAVWASKVLKRLAISPSSTHTPSSSSNREVQRLTVGFRHLLFPRSRSSAPAFAISEVSWQKCSLCEELRIFRGWPDLRSLSLCLCL